MSASICRVMYEAADGYNVRLVCVAEPDDGGRRRQFGAQLGPAR